jgi:ribose 5-phosphate isomerase B
VQIAIASDHAGLELRKVIAEHLAQAGHTVTDHGPDSGDSVDYPDYAEKVARAVVGDASDLGVLVCGSGIGMSIAANKVQGVRAALCANAYLGEMARAHNNANVLCLGERITGVGLALTIVDAFVSTKFEGGRHSRRVDKIAELET